MGHIRLGDLPRTRKWKEVVRLLEAGAQVDQVANATIRAAADGLRLAPKDPGVLETVWLLIQLPSAARSQDFVGSLRDCGLQIDGAPTLMELVGAFTDAVDSRLGNNRGRTDLGEMAQMAGVETLARVVGSEVSSLYETGPEEVRRAAAELFTVKNFGHFARHFFARLTFKCLDYFLSRVLSNLVGERRRFTTLAMQTEFCQALETHCDEAAHILDRFSGEWTAKVRWEAGNISRESVGAFVGGAMSKLIDELERGAGVRGQ
jgi:hypothetical protein